MPTSLFPPVVRHWLVGATLLLTAIGSALTPAPGEAGGATAHAGTPASAVVAALASPPQSFEAPPATVAAALARPAAGHPVLPVGKGMWIHRVERVAGGDPKALVRAAKAAGLTHVYLRLGSSKQGFAGRNDLERLLPVAHAAGIRVVGWDFPYLHDPIADAERAAEMIRYRTRSGHGIDSFSADIETRAEGTNLTTAGVTAYGAHLRALVGPSYPLIATVPRPNPKRWFPYAEATAAFDAIAPMVYWINRDPVADLAGAVAALAPLGKPLLPVGQAYDPALDGTPHAGPPPPSQIDRFIDAAAVRGAIAVSFWAWDTATREQWLTIAAAPEFDLGPADDPVATRFLQRLLTAFGHETVDDGNFGTGTSASLTALQRRWGLAPTGELDPSTVATLLGPRPL